MNAKLVSALVVLVALAGAGMASGVPTAAQDSLPNSQNATDLGFGADEVVTPHGGTATIPVRLNESGTATVKIGSESEDNYALVVTVEDGDDDGRVNLTFDTDAAGEPNATKVTTGGAADGATVVSEVEYLGDEPPLPALAGGIYPVTLYEGNGTDSEPVADSVMLVEEPTTTTTTDGETATTTEETTATGTVTDTATTTADATTGTGGSVPGFGPALAVVALAAAAMLAARR